MSPTPAWQYRHASQFTFQMGDEDHTQTVWSPQPAIDLQNNLIGHNNVFLFIHFIYFLTYQILFSLSLV